MHRAHRSSCPNICPDARFSTCASGCSGAGKKLSATSNSCMPNSSMPGNVITLNQVPWSSHCDNDVLGKLNQFCTERLFRPGELVRKWGEHYNDAFFILDGKLEVELSKADPTPQQRAAGPIGEMGFLWGTPACATITASESTRVLRIDDEILNKVKQDQPALASAVLSMLTRFAQQRLNTGINPYEETGCDQKKQDIDIYLCRGQQQLKEAQSLRYDVYCTELGRSSPNAQHADGVIADELDALGKTFIAVADGQTVGTLRANLAREGSLGPLEELYYMKRSPHHPHATAVCTKFILRPSARGGPAAIRLISALTRHLIRHGIHECFIDCIPSLLHYYRAMGFEVAGEKFMHPETGISIPLRIDLRRHGKLLSGAMGLKGMMQIYVKAKSYKLLARLGTG